MSAGLRSIGVNSEAALNKFSALQEKTNKVKSIFKDFGTTVFSLKEKLDLLHQERDLLPASNITVIQKYNKEIQKLETNIEKLENNKGGSVIGNWFKNALSGIPAILTNPVTLIGAGLGAAMSKGMEADMQKANLLTLLRGNADKANELYGNLTNYANKTPYEKSDLIEAQKTMMSFGMTADNAYRHLQEIGDIALGSKEKMQSLALAFAQVNSAGKLQGQDLLQLINGGFNPLQTISEKTGESMASLRTRMEKGKVSADEVAKAFQWATDQQGQFYKGADKAGQTLGGKWSTLTDSISTLLLSVYSLIEPVMMPLIQLATTVVDTISTKLTAFISFLQSGNPIVQDAAVIIGWLAASLLVYNAYIFLSNAYTSIATKITTLWAERQGVLNAVLTANPIGILIAAIVALIMTIGYVIYAYDGWGKAWDNLVKFLQYSWAGFKESFHVIWLGVQDVFLTGIETIEKAWYELQKLWDKDASNSALGKINDEQNKRATERILASKAMADDINKAVASASQITGSIHKNGKGLSDMKNDLLGKLGLGGITAPGLPGAAATTNSKGGGNKPGNTGTNTTSAIATGGTKNTTVNISIGKLVEKMLFEGGAKENMGKMRDMIVDELTRAVAMGASLGGNN